MALRAKPSEVQEEAFKAPQLERPTRVSFWLGVWWEIPKFVIFWPPCTGKTWLVVRIVHTTTKRGLRNCRSRRRRQIAPGSNDLAEASRSTKPSSLGFGMRYICPGKNGVSRDHRDNHKLGTLRTNWKLGIKSLYLFLPRRQWFRPWWWLHLGRQKDHERWSATCAW